MAAPKMLSEAQIEAALRSHAGIMSFAAKALGVTRSAVHIRVDRSPRLQAVAAEVRETILDAAEGNIAKAINKGDVQTSRWYAERLGQGRGYGNKVHATIDIGAIEALAASFGGDLAKLRAFRAAVEASAGTLVVPADGH